MGSSCKFTDHDLDCLEALVSPFSAREFLATVWGRRFIHIEGDSDKFRHLFTWDQLNLALEQYPFEPPRLKLNRDGKEIEIDRYFATEHLGNRGGMRHLIASELAKQLRQGATLILNCADEISSPLRETCTGLERIFRDHVIGNLFAVFTNGHAYPIHWDSHDALVLQVFGRMQWAVFEPTRPYPLREDQESPPRPTSAPIWEGHLKQGDLFHIPRGWWHVRYPDDQPSLQLTITVVGPTGLDLLRWCVDRLKTSASVGSNVPLFEPEENQKRYAEILKDELFAALSGNAVEQFLVHRDACAVPRPQMRLPDAAIVIKEPVTESDWVRLASPRSLAVKAEVDSSTITFECARKAWRCPSFLLPAITLLNDKEKHRLREVLATISDQEQWDTVKQFVSQLIQVGVLVPERAQEHGQSA